MYKIKQNFEVSVPEHEVLLSFNSDEDAELFIRWWESLGEDQFYESYVIYKDEDNT